MPATTSSNSPSSPGETGGIGSFISPSMQFPPKAPESKHDATHSVPDPAPVPVGTSTSWKLSTDAYQAPDYDSASFEPVITQDFECNRVFADIDVFMEHVLHVPEDWRETWGLAIKKIKLDKAFSSARSDYSHQCEIEGLEKRLYKPLVDMANAILRCSGITNKLSPDFVAVHHDFLPHSSEEREEREIQQSNISCAHPFHVLEFKLSGGALVDGLCMPRLMVNGQDPWHVHAYPSTPKKSAHNGAASASVLTRSRKRPADEFPESSRKAAKAHRKSSPGNSSDQVAERMSPRHWKNETESQKDAYLQVGRYLMEQLSIPALRSHATIGLVDRDRIQFYHANHSVIFVSSAINFLSNDYTNGLDKFIAIVIAFSRLSLRDNGILHDLHDGKMLRGNEKLPISGLAPGSMRTQGGNKLEFGGDEKTKPFTLTYGETISHDPSLAGRATVVLHAESSMWEELDLVVKIGWPGSDKPVENAFLAKAAEIAESTEDDKWALNHLPRVLFAQDVALDSNSTHDKIASLFDNAEFAGQEYDYEPRTRRIIIQERLYRFKTLTKVEDIAQVLLDVGCVHRWLYIRAGILHCDLSLSNVMYRIVEGKVCGVLADFDNALWTVDPKKDPTETPRHCWGGTLPFMAYELLYRLDAPRLYRHDLESLFYVMLILTTQYDIHPPTEEEDGGLRVRRQEFEELPYAIWFSEPSLEDLASYKHTIFSNLRRLDLSPAFEDFRDWLDDLRMSFQQGFRARDTYENKYRFDSESEDEDTSEFDGETLEGHVDYSALINPVRKLKGKLKGLIVRYPPSTSAAEADG